MVRVPDTLDLEHLLVSDLLWPIEADKSPEIVGEPAAGSYDGSGELEKRC